METITGRSFLERIVGGQREFRNIILNNANLEILPGYSELIQRSNELYSNSHYGKGLNFSGAVLDGLVATGLCLNGSTFQETQLLNSSIPMSSLNYCRFLKSKIEGLNLETGSFSCNEVRDCAIDGFNVWGSTFFENSILKSILFNVNGIGTNSYVSTSELADVVVDSATYRLFQQFFPKHSPLTAKSVSEGAIVLGRKVPSGSMLINGKYYLDVMFGKAGE